MDFPAFERACVVLHRKVTMLELGPRQRELLAETSRDVANIAAGAMVFGQFLGERPFSSSIALGGVALWACLVTFAIRLLGKTQT